MYSRKEIEPGRFVYIRRKNLENLYLGYKISKKRLYKKLASFRGSFPEILEQHFNQMGINLEGIANATYADYEREKNKAIMSIGNEEPEREKSKQELKELKGKIGRLKFPINNMNDLAGQLAKSLGVSARTIYRWQENEEKSVQIDPPRVFDTDKLTEYNNSGYKGEIVTC